MGLEVSIVTIAVIVLGTVLALILALLVRSALNSLRAEHAEIAADPRARSEAWSRMGPQVIAAEERRRSGAGRPGCCGVSPTPECRSSGRTGWSYPWSSCGSQLT